MRYAMMRTYSGECLVPLRDVSHVFLVIIHMLAAACLLFWFAVLTCLLAFLPVYPYLPACLPASFLLACLFALLSFLACPNSCSLFIDFHYLLLMFHEKYLTRQCWHYFSTGILFNHVILQENHRRGAAPTKKVFLTPDETAVVDEGYEVVDRSLASSRSI